MNRKQTTGNKLHFQAKLKAAYRILCITVNRILPQNKWLRRITITIIAICLLLVGGMYGIARWYMWTQRDVPTTLGVSFIPDYASYLGVDPQKTMDALVTDLHIKQFRLTSYWSDIETSPGHYDFSQLDWEFAKAQAAHATVTLSIGLRQPRWPECHAPSFYDTSKPESQWYPELQQYVTAVINRYKNSPSLQSYQLENEFYLNNFGECHNADQSRLVSEFNLVKKLDDSHPIIMSRSDNLPDWPPNTPAADEVGMSVYRRVWDGNLTKRYFTYPMPSWYYGFLAGVQKIRYGQNSMLHELQTEAWPPNGQSILQTSLAEQNKSFNAQRLTDAVSFAKKTGLKHIDLWGGEYWYYRMEVLHDPSVWNAAKHVYSEQR